MAKKVKKQKPGAPEWMVTFGDLMSLLLTFFILLQMFSQLKEEHEYQRVLQSIKEAFGYTGGVGTVPVNDTPLRSMIEKLEDMAMRVYEKSSASQADDPGLSGTHVRVSQMREGIIFTIGGPSTFDELSADIKPEVRAQIEKLSVMLKGRRNKITIRGHAAPAHLPPNSPWRDLDELSYARASNVKDLLLELGLDDRVFRLEAVGTREPVVARAVDPAELAENRRVEVILTEQLVEELDGDVNFTDPNLARKGLNNG